MSVLLIWNSLLIVHRVVPIASSTLSGYSAPLLTYQPPGLLGTSLPHHAHFCPGPLHGLFLPPLELFLLLSVVSSLSPFITHFKYHILRCYRSTATPSIFLDLSTLFYFLIKEKKITMILSPAIILLIICLFVCRLCPSIDCKLHKDRRLVRLAHHWLPSGQHRVCNIVGARLICIE